MKTQNSQTPNSGSSRESLNFADAAIHAFRFLNELGFSMIDKSSTIVRYHKDDLGVEVYHGRSSYELGFEVIRKGVKYSLGEFIHALDQKPAKQYHYYAATTQSAVIEGLALLSEKVRQYGIRALQNDSEFFNALDNQRSGRSQELEFDVLESQLRPRAEEAFRNENYIEAAELYERIKSRLTPTELKKLDFAKKHS